MRRRKGSEVLAPLQHKSLTTRHGFFTRKGGNSSGIYDSLNLGRGSDDVPDKVAANRQLVENYFDNAKLITLFQLHSPKVFSLTEDINLPRQSLKGDALVTNRKDIAIGVLTADCVPVLFHAPKACIIGAAHAGWRGAFSGILENTLAAMIKLGAHKTDIKAVIGPCISGQNYEIDRRFYESFCKADAHNHKFFTPAQQVNHWMFDLCAYGAYRCQQAGCQNIEQMNHCTYASESQFYSYRRSYHRGEPDYGRQISAISLNSL